MGTNTNKFVAYASAITALSVANNIGFHGNCEVHESEPACRGVPADPIHTHHEMPSAYGTNTTTATGTGYIISMIPGAMNFTGTSASIGTFNLQARLPNDEVAEFEMNQQDDQVDEGLLPGLCDSAPVQS